MGLHKNDILTKVSRFNLIRDGRMLFIDIHQRIQGNLAGDFVAVPNLVNIIAKPEHQGVGDNEAKALDDCLNKIRGLKIENLFPDINPLAQTPDDEQSKNKDEQ